MSQRLGGSGAGLPPPQYLYPSELTNAAVDQGSNRVGLAAGEAIVIPAGDWSVQGGPYTFLQAKDPVTGSWFGFSTMRPLTKQVHSDGVNFRIANLTGCPVAAIVVVGGSGYVAASTTVVASAGGSTWQPVVGGMLSITTISVAGSGYGVAPLVLIPAPPSPGVQASAHAVITGGSVTSVVLDNVGAGYITAPAITIVPSPFDPNLPTAPVTAKATAAIVGAGSISAVICTNNGAPVSTAPTLTVAGVGSSASVAAVLLQTITSGSVVNGGTGISAAGITTIGGTPSNTPQYTNPAIQLTSEIPRQAQLSMALAGGSLVSVSTVIDGGLFFGTPSAVVLTNGLGTAPSLASVTVALGSTFDTSFITPI